MPLSESPCREIKQDGQQSLGCCKTNVFPLEPGWTVSTRRSDVTDARWTKRLSHDID